VSTATTQILFVLARTVRKAVTQPRNAALSARMALWVLLVSVLARLTTLARVQRIAAFRLRSAPIGGASQTPANLGRMIDSLLKIDLFVFRRSCWKRALVLHRYLALNGIESQILFGLRKEADGKVDGHAWLERRGQPLLEDNALNYIVTFSLPRETMM
jgi:Transglutaminase-like superfamily